jgi:4-hydroxybenzoate polyprenyltransferase
MTVTQIVSFGSHQKNKAVVSCSGTTATQRRNVARGVLELARLHTRESWLCWYPAIWGSCVAAGMQDVSLEVGSFARLLFGIWASVTATHCTFCTYK